MPNTVRIAHDYFPGEIRSTSFSCFHLDRRVKSYLILIVCNKINGFVLIIKMHHRLIYHVSIKKGFFSKRKLRSTCLKDTYEDRALQRNIAI